MSRITVLFIVSGTGESNALKAGIYLAKRIGFNVSIASHQDQTTAYNIAVSEGVPYIKIAGIQDKGLWKKELLDCIFQVNPSMIFLMYNRIIPSEVLQLISCPIINIHPSVLPSFSGFLAVNQALQYKVKFTGVTAHLVDETIDGGKPIIQTVIPILKSYNGYNDLSPILNEHYCRIVYTLLFWLHEQINIDNELLVQKILEDFCITDTSIRDMYPDPYADIVKDLPIFK